MNYFSILTSIGLAKLIKATANSEQIILSQMGVSDDRGEISQDMQTLPNERHKFSINSITQSGTDANVLICEGVIVADVGGFYIRKVGIYADDGSLFAVGVVPESYKPLLAEGSAKDITIKFYLQVDNSANITLKVDNNIVLATRNYVKDEIKKLNSELETKFLPLTGKAADSTLLNGKRADEYALKSELTDGLPIGAYLQWSSERKTPAGFLVCDGRSLNKSEYAELFEVIGYTYGGSGERFNIPKFDDGRFMRSVGGNAAPLGEAQQDEIKSHTHTFDGYYLVGSAGGNGWHPGATNKNAVGYTGGSETRPYNMSVVVLIKAKDVKEPKSNQIDDSIYATEVKAGITKLKNEITGNAQDVAVTEKAVNEIKNQILGINQTWQNMTSQRQVGVTYTNTTGRPIQVSILMNNSSSTNSYDFQVNGVSIQKYSQTYSGFGCTFIIPSTSTYKITSNTTILNWFELR
ncbi:phage tail protein [Campylobacter sp. 9BO]|uniref:phage tail-collar fiber domain-containing protein n=1 Tax=Campylobacter sp. 9BO TaxID=3424759 RepID=UPI003D333088